MNHNLSPEELRKLSQELRDAGRKESDITIKRPLCSRGLSFSPRKPKPWSARTGAKSRILTQINTAGPGPRFNIAQKRGLRDETVSRSFRPKKYGNHNPQLDPLGSIPCSFGPSFSDTERPIPCFHA